MSLGKKELLILLNAQFAIEMPVCQLSCAPLFIAEQHLG